MRFFCLSDTHGDPPPARARSMTGQVILHAGDFYNEGVALAHSDWDKIVADNDILVTRGNHDCVETPFLDGHDLTFGFSRVGDLWVVGVGWCGTRYDQLPTEALMTRMVVGLMGAIARVFSDGDRSLVVTHYPPTHPMLKNREGFEFRCLSGLVEAIRPVAVVAGHRHGMAGRVLYQGDCPIIFPGPDGGWLDVSDGARWSR